MIFRACKNCVTREQVCSNEADNQWKEIVPSHHKRMLYGVGGGSCKTIVSG